MVLDIFTDDELLRMSNESYELLRGMLDDFVAQEFKAYMESSFANPEVVAVLQEHLGRDIENLTYLRNLTISPELEQICHHEPEYIPSLTINVEAVAEELADIQEKRKDLNHTVIPCSATTFKDFVESLKALDDGERNPPLYKVVKANSSLFYTPNQQARPINPHFSNTNYNIWDIKLKALRYMVAVRQVSNGRVFPRWIA